MTNEKTRKITLSNGEVVEILNALTWGQKESIQNIYLKGAKINQTGISDFDASVLTESKYRLFEICIIGIEKDGEIKKFTKEWIDNLSIEDGDLLFDSVNVLTEKKV